jgi:hypothetical protein
MWNGKPGKGKFGLQSAEGKLKIKFGERRILIEGSINSLKASSLGKHFDWYYGTHYSMPSNLMLRMGKYV